MWDVHRDRIHTDMGRWHLRVKILDGQTGVIIASGECDGKRFDDFYVKVIKDGQSDKSAAATLTFAASVFPEEYAERISVELTALHAKVKEAQDAYSKALYTAANEYKAFGGTKL